MRNQRTMPKFLPLVVVVPSEAIFEAVLTVMFVSASMAVVVALTASVT